MVWGHPLWASSDSALLAQVCALLAQAFLVLVRSLSYCPEDPKGALFTSTGTKAAETTRKPAPGRAVSQSASIHGEGIPEGVPFTFQMAFRAFPSTRFYKKERVLRLECYAAKYVGEHCQQLSGLCYCEIYLVFLGRTDACRVVSISFGYYCLQ